MTTLKEYKAMTEQTKTDGDAFALALASAMIAPDLIRVIELAEEALDSALLMAINECWPVEEMQIEYALSEIRKLKGK